MKLSVESRLQAILEGTQAGTWEWNLETDEFSCNERWAEMLGYHLEELAPISKRTLVSLCHPDDRATALAVFDSFLCGRPSRYETTLRFRHKVDGWRVIQTRAVLASSETPSQHRWLVGSNEDVTATYKSKDQLEILAESMPGLIFSFVIQTDGHSYFSYISKKVEEFYGVTQDDARRDARTVYRAVLLEDRPKVERSLADSTDSMSQWRCDYRIRKDDVITWMRAIATPTIDDDDSILWQGFVINVDKEKRLELALEQLSITDELSGLYNRRYLFQRLEELIAIADRHGGGFSLLSLDIDHFKSVNDTYGHMAGDRIIKTFGALMRQRLRKSDIAARVGGEEFLVAMPNTDVECAKKVAEELRIAFAAATRKDGEVKSPITFSAGLVSYPKDAVCLRELLSRSDELLYEAKRNGRNQIVMVD